MQLLLSVGGVDPVEGLEELAEWLDLEPELRGRVQRVPAASEPGTLGAADVLVAAISAGGTVSVLAASLKAYLSQPRRAHVRIVVQDPDGRRVELDAEHVRDIETLVREVLGREG
jgi:hypothetical protein